MGCGPRLRFWRYSAILAAMPRIIHAAGDRIGADELNAIAAQGVHTFADTTARDAAYTSSDPAATGEVVLLDDGSLQRWDGDSWEALGGGPTVSAPTVVVSDFDSGLQDANAIRPCLDADDNAFTWPATVANDDFFIVSPGAYSTAYSQGAPGIITGRQYNSFTGALDITGTDGSVDMSANADTKALVAFEQRLVNFAGSTLVVRWAVGKCRWRASSSDAWTEDAVAYIAISQRFSGLYITHYKAPVAS